MNNFEQQNFCSFEASKNLKEIGFDDGVFGRYDSNGVFELNAGICYYSNKFTPELTIAPLFTQVAQWFWTEFDITINVTRFGDWGIEPVCRYEVGWHYRQMPVQIGDKYTMQEAYNVAIIVACEMVVKERAL